MSTKLWMIAFDEPRFAEESPQHFSFGSAHHASPQELVAALIAEGGEIVEHVQHGRLVSDHDDGDYEPGRYLVYGPLSETPEVPT